MLLYIFKVCIQYFNKNVSEDQLKNILNQALPNSVKDVTFVFDLYDINSINK